MGPCVGGREDFQKDRFVFFRKIRNQISGWQKKKSIKKCVRDQYLRTLGAYHFQKPNSKANLEGTSLTAVSI